MGQQPGHVRVGRVLHRLITSGTALLTAHTNADVPDDGVNEALAAALGLVDTEVLAATDGGGMDKVVVFVPLADADAVRRVAATC